jgi:hypothetical protein
MDDFGGFEEFEDEELDDEEVVTDEHEVMALRLATMWHLSQGVDGFREGAIESAFHHLASCVGLMAGADELGDDEAWDVVSDVAELAGRALVLVGGWVGMEDEVQAHVDEVWSAEDDWDGDEPEEA